MAKRKVKRVVKLLPMAVEVVKFKCEYCWKIVPAILFPFCYKTFLHRSSAKRAGERVLARMKVTR